MEDTKQHKRKPISRKVQVFVYRRDKWLCHWCKRPVVFPPAMKYLQELLAKSGYGDLAYWRYAYDRHGAPLLDELAAAIDHIKAVTLGGTDDVENLTTACNKCNTRKNNCDAKKWETEHPFRRINGKFGEPQAWDGFSSLFLFLAKTNASSLKRSEIEWLKALQALEEKPTVNVEPVEAEPEKRESHIVDITDEFVKSGKSLIFTGQTKLTGG